MTTISTILLAALLIVSVCYNLYCTMRCYDLDEYAEGLESRNKLLSEINDVTYDNVSRLAGMAMALTNTSPNDKYMLGECDRAINVYRIHYGTSVLIKSFACTDTEDYEYKMRCAEELLEMLNENPD